MTSSLHNNIGTWDQLNFGGQAIRFHSETIGKTTLEWECPEPDNCDACRNYEHNQERNKP